MDHYIVMAEININGGEAMYAILGSTRSYDGKALKESFLVHLRKKYPNAEIAVKIHSKATVSKEEYFARMPWFIDHT